MPLLLDGFHAFTDCRPNRPICKPPSFRAARGRAKRAEDVSRKLFS
jgi:hypothetical protein